MKLALVKDNVVVDIKDLTEEQIYEIDKFYSAIININGMNPEPKVGWILNGNTLVNTDNSSPSMKITKLALRQRFTITELTNIYNSMSTIPIIKILMDNVMISTFIDLSRQDTIAGINVLVSYGLITQERAEEILTTVPTTLEKYLENN